MEMDVEACYRAIASRDRRFEGRFVLGVKTTGVYCRPGCPAPLPKRVNTLFFSYPAAAEEAGFRPCMRCRPDTSPGSPLWSGTSATVTRALKLILDGTLDDDGVETLAERLGIGSRHLRRLFSEHVGASPAAIARTRRAHFARKLIDETGLPMTQVAFGAGFSSIRRFNESIRDTFRKSPRALRRTASNDPAAPLTLRLPYREPFDWSSLIQFLAVRATPGVEVVDADAYRRTVMLDGSSGWLDVRPISGESALSLSLHVPVTKSLVQVVARVNHLFDLAADPLQIASCLDADPRLAVLLVARPGLRVPGAWSPFELAVRAILGQQVTVKGATTLTGRLVSRFGTPCTFAAPGLTHLFPEATALAAASPSDLAAIGIPGARAGSLRSLAGAVASGGLELESLSGLDEIVARLTELPGIGPWTAHYIAMRAFREPDAFPPGDLGLIRAYSSGGSSASPVTSADLTSRAEAWRPFRAYAALHLWTSESATTTKKQETQTPTRRKRNKP
jgi:AraC family transcriptional regulator of adaptative response / DNA-3-methyladenine glycosylase II